MAESDTNVNPYAAPGAHASSGDYVSLAEPQDKSVHGWLLLMVALNIPLPLYFGVGCTSGPGSAGMGFGIVLIAVVGLFACSRFPRTMERLCLGSMLTALAQFYPIAHMFVGMMAIEITRLLLGSSESGIVVRGISATTSVTVMTGTGIIIPALIAGTLIDLIFRPFESPGRPPWLKGRRKQANLKR